MSDIFTSIEFYITALAVAIAILAFFGADNETVHATTDLYSPSVTPCDDQADSIPAIVLKAADDGRIEVTRHGMVIPAHCSVYIKADIVGDRITLTERITADNRATANNDMPCSLHFAIHAKSGRKYFVRYECPSSTLWAATHFANYGGYTTTLPLKA